MRDLDPRPPAPGGVHVTYTSPGGIAVKPFAEGYLTIRVCLGHLHHAEDGLLAELAPGREPVPWASGAVREEAMAEIRRRAGGAEGDDRATLTRLLEHVRRTPYYVDA